MNNGTNNHGLFTQFEHIFQCPYCSNSMKMADQKSMKCKLHHTFDLTKQGYINFLTRPFKGNYSKLLFEARHRIISLSGLYAPITSFINGLLSQYGADSNQPLHVLDAGSGEGSHLNHIIKDSTMLGFGIDIAKEAISMASKRYKNQIWVVGDLAYSPFKEKQFDAILNIFSPSNYEEFDRLLKHNGVVIKVVPRPNYFIEVRQLLYDHKKRAYSKDEMTIAHFKNNLQLIDSFPISYTRQLNQSERVSLFQMTPLTWNHKARMEQLENQSDFQITIDVEVLLGKKQEKRRV